jgi:hypothetical protein
MADIVFDKSVFKHGYMVADIESVLGYPLGAVKLYTDVWVYIGWSTAGTLLEVMVHQNGFIKVFHCMRARKKFIQLLKY